MMSVSYCCDQKKSHKQTVTCTSLLIAKLFGHYNVVLKQGFHSNINPHIHIYRVMQCFPVFLKQHLQIIYNTSFHILKNNPSFFETLFFWEHYINAPHSLVVHCFHSNSIKITYKCYATVSNHLKHVCTH